MAMETSTGVNRLARLARWLATAGGTGVGTWRATREPGKYQG